MGGCLMCSRALVIVFNIIMFILGAGLLGCGVFIRFYADQHLRPLIVNATVAMRAIDPTLYVDPATIKPDLTQFLNIGIVLIVLGGVLLVVTMIGCCGATCNQFWAAVAYAVLFGLMTIAHLILVIMLMTRQLDPYLKEMGRSTMKDFKGVLGLNADSLMWNYLQYTFHCCGVDSAKDFTSVYTPAWNRNPILGGQTLQTLVSPITCCTTMSALPKCAEDPLNILNYRKYGCFGEIEKYLIGKGIMVYITIVLICSTILMVLVLMLAIAMAVELGKERKRKQNKLGNYQSSATKNYDYSAHRSGKKSGGYYDNYGQQGQQGQHGQQGAYPDDYLPSYDTMYNGKGSSRAYYESKGF